MKAVLTTITACLISLLSIAQSVTIKKDIVYKDDQPYCKLVKSGGLTPRYSIRNFKDEELIVSQFSNEQQRYNIIFVGSGRTCHMQGTLGYGKILAKYLVADRVIVNDKVSEEGERLFLLEQGEGSASPGLVDPPATDRYKPLDRDRTALLMIFGKNISQDNKTIGTYSVTQTSTNGHLVKRFSFFLPNGEKIADASLEGINPGSAHLVIIKNNQRTTIGITTFDDVSIVKEIAGYLVEHLLL